MFRNINNGFTGMRMPDPACLGEEYGRMLAKRAKRNLLKACLDSPLTWLVVGLLIGLGIRRVQEPEQIVQPSPMENHLDKANIKKTEPNYTFAKNTGFKSIV
ncbi:hypothetical protein ACFLWR_00490 [Chloroflexota bacterium]